MTKHVLVHDSCLHIPDNKLPPPVSTFPAFEKCLSRAHSVPGDLTPHTRLGCACEAEAWAGPGAPP